jgi:hypothetical protein
MGMWTSQPSVEVCNSSPQVFTLEIALLSFANGSLDLPNAAYLTHNGSAKPSNLPKTNLIQTPTLSIFALQAEANFVWNISAAGLLSDSVCEVSLRRKNALTSRGEERWEDQNAR